MRKVKFSPHAERDLEDVLFWTRENFGVSAELRYYKLLQQAIRDLRLDPLRPGSELDAGLGLGLRIYHLRQSRTHVPATAGRVKKPRHIVLFRLAGEDLIEIVRVLHDGSDLARHLPTDFDD